jgi:hypothetical protein
MENNHPDSIAVEVDGKTKFAKFTPGAIDAAATRHGYRIKFSELSDLAISDFTRIAWIAFLHDTPSLKFSKFLEWELPFQQVMEIAGDAGSSLAEGPDDSGSDKAGKGKPGK